jgi:hypothetical protein
LTKRSLSIGVIAALAIAVALAGCGKTTYFAGRQLPPSKLPNRVMIAVQNPSSLSKGALVIVDAYYDIRSGYTGSPSSFSISGYSGSLPTTIQNMPEEQTGAIYNSGDGSLSLVSYAKESGSGSVSGSGAASIFVTRNLAYAFAADQSNHVLTVSQVSGGGSLPLGLPGVYRVSVNPGGTMALAFVKNSNYAYYPVQLTTAQTLAYSGGPTTWPKAAIDCEPQSTPIWCLYQVQSPDNHYVDGAGFTQYYGAPLTFDRPIKAVFSNDGSTAYVLNCGPECGGTKAGFTTLPVSPVLFPLGQASGLLPTQSALNASTLAIPGGASNALVVGTTMYVVGQQQMPDGFWGGQLTTVTLPTTTAPASASAPVSVSDGFPGGPSRIIEADDDTLWIAMTKCNNGERANNNQPYGCLTMYNTSTGTVTMLESYKGDATGVAAVLGLNKVYTAEGGQVYIYSTKDGTTLDNQYVTVTGVASDVAYLDAVTDADNTVY